MLCEVFSMCYVSMHASLASLGGSSLRSLRPLRGRCGRFAAAGDHCVPGCLVESEGQREAAEPPNSHNVRAHFGSLLLTTNKH